MPLGQAKGNLFCRGLSLSLNAVEEKQECAKDTHNSCWWRLCFTEGWEPKSCITKSVNSTCERLKYKKQWLLCELYCVFKPGEDVVFSLEVSISTLLLDLCTGWMLNDSQKQRDWPHVSTTYRDLLHAKDTKRPKHLLEICFKIIKWMWLNNYEFLDVERLKVNLPAESQSLTSPINI